MKHHDLRTAGDQGPGSGPLAERIRKRTAGLGRLDTQIPGLSLVCRTEPTEPVSYMHEAGVCLIAEGAKRVTLGDEVYDYDAHHYLITSVGLPVVAQVVEASEEKPYLGMLLELDPRMIAKLMLDGDVPAPRVREASRGMATGVMTQPLADAFARLLDLLDAPEDIPVMAPIIKQEIFYRLLTGEQGQRLRQIATTGSHSNQISKALAWLKDNFAQPLRVDDLASQAGMSTSTFHHHFRTLTAMSPLQYQKWLRLNEARQLMLTGRLDAATAAFQVGYESPSQFSREYSRLFGAPPMRDIRQMGEGKAQESRTM